MATGAKAGQGKAVAKDRTFAHLRATPEELERLRAMAPPPRSLEEWLGPPRGELEEELAELEWFLRDRETRYRSDIERQEERLTDLKE